MLKRIFNAHGLNVDQLNRSNLKKPDTAQFHIDLNNDMAVYIKKKITTGRQ